MPAKKEVKKTTDIKTFSEGLHFSTATPIMADDKGALPTEIMILPVGEWNTMQYGPLQVTLAHVAQMVDNYSKATRKLVPIDIDHSGGEAAGWVNELIDKGADGLHAKVEWNDLGQEKLSNKRYRLFSPEFSLQYVDPEFGTAHGAVLVAGSLTNRPLFKELPVLMANDNDGKNAPLTNGKGVMLILSQDTNKKDMPNELELDKVKAKAPADLTDEEKTFLADHKGDLTPEEKEKFDIKDEKTPEQVAQEKADADKAAADQKAKEEADAKAKTDAEAANNNGGGTGTPVEGKDGVKVLTASEYKSLSEKAAQGEKAMGILTAKEATEKINSYKASAKGGKLTPKAAEVALGFYLKCSEADKVEFIKVIESLPELKLAGEIGNSDANSPLTAGEQIAKIVEGYMNTDKTLSADDAFAKAEKEQPELYKQYLSDMKGVTK